jgi:hypothetical protein
MANPSDRGLGNNNALLAAAIVVAAAILSWGGPDEAPRYQLAASESGVYRMNTDSGEIIGCGIQGCNRVQEPDRAKTLGLFGISRGDPNKKPPDSRKLENPQ